MTKTKEDFLRDALMDQAEGLAKDFINGMKSIGYTGGFILTEESGVPGKPATKVDILLRDTRQPVIITLSGDSVADQQTVSAAKTAHHPNPVIGLCEEHATEYFKLPFESEVYEGPHGEGCQCGQQEVEKQDAEGGYRQFDVDHRDNGPLHRLHVAWAIEELLVINTFMATMHDFSRVNASLIAASVAEEKLAKCQEDAAWYEAAAIIESGENLESWLSISRRNVED